MHRRCKRNRPNKPYKKMTRLRVSRWRGFKIEVWNNHAYNLRYEWKIYPLSDSLKRMSAFRGSLYSVIHDHTSTYNARECLYDAKQKVNELVSLHFKHSWYWCNVSYMKAK